MRQADQFFKRRKLLLLLPKLSMLGLILLLLLLQEPLQFADLLLFLVNLLLLFFDGVD